MSGASRALQCAAPAAVPALAPGPGACLAGGSHAASTHCLVGWEPLGVRLPSLPSVWFSQLCEGPSPTSPASPLHCPFSPSTVVVLLCPQPTFRLEVPLDRGGCSPTTALHTTKHWPMGSVTGGACATPATECQKLTCFFCDSKFLLIAVCGSAGQAMGHCVAQDTVRQRILCGTGCLVGSWWVPCTGSHTQSSWQLLECADATK